MVATTDINLQQDLISSFEELMVKQFRALQYFVDISRKERTVLTKGDAKSLMPLVNEKESALEQLSVLEDSLHMVMEEISKDFGLEPKTVKVSDILAHIDHATAERVSRLRDGIISLSDEARDLNLANRALATTTLEWLDSAQKILLEFYSGPEIYDSFGHKPTGVDTVYIRDVDRKA